MNIAVFDAHESNVMRYGRTFPVVFDRASGPFLTDVSGKTYFDFILGSGALNYGHNHPAIKCAVLDYLAEESVILSLDMYTTAKSAFLSDFVSEVLASRNMTYKVQFPGPTGTNANEAALALARKATGRQTVFAFTNSFHGMSLGSLSVSGSESTRSSGGVSRHDVIRIPYDGFPEPGFPAAELIEAFLQSSGSGVDKPAAIMLETVQAEGGLNVASRQFLQRISKMCRNNGVLLIVDDIQAGSGRCGTFFSFEDAGIQPDIVTLSKSLSGFGIPLSLVLIRPDIDVWKPGEHSGTFRGSNLAFVSARAAVSLWQDVRFVTAVATLRQQLQDGLDELCKALPNSIEGKRGKGLMAGLKLRPGCNARTVISNAFARGLLIESSGPERQVLKVFPALTTTGPELKTALELLEQSIRETENAA
jgi:diaminobutyrate-2-oxoglutarate transaminase